MNFLNAILLGGIAALAIPIIIHLFHKSRFKVVRWGAMHLLENVIRTNQRRIKFEQWLLVALRAALPVILALLMARPVWKGAQALLGDAKTSTVALLDNSYSMQATRAGLSTWTTARDTTEHLLNDLKRGSEAQLVLMGEGGSAVIDTPTYDPSRLVQALHTLSPSYGSATVPSALDFASNVFAKMHESSRSLVVLTDFQRVSFEQSEDALITQMLDRLRKQQVPPNIVFFDVGQEVTDNVAIESLDLSKLLVGVGQKIQVRANIRNFGDAQYPDLRVYFKVDGKEKAASQIKLGPRQNAQVLFTHKFEEAGSHVIEISEDADALKADNSLFASVPVRDKLPVVLVNGDPNPEPLKGETDFAEIALQPFGMARVELADLIAPKVIRVDGLKADVLTGVSVLMLANVSRLDDAQVKLVEEFVRNGGGLLIAPGNRTDAAWWNNVLFKAGKGLLPYELGALGGDTAGAGVSVVAQHFEHPALELFNDPRNGSLSEGVIKQWFKLKDDGAAHTEGAPSILARLDSNDPFLAEKQFGEGRVFQLATAIDADWSNLPVRPTYLPLMQRLTTYLASTVYPPRNLRVGGALIAFLPIGDAGKVATLTTPNGQSVEVPIVKKGTRGVAEFARTQSPGLYVLTPPDKKALHYVVNASRRESDLQKLTEKEIDDFAKAHDVKVVHNEAEYKQLEHTRRFGREFWKPLLLVLLVGCYGELLLQQKMSRARKVK
jgi:hypothetical protein